jgi:integron integrase
LQLEVSMSQPKLLDRVRSAMALKHMSTRTEKAYLYWIRRFVVFHHMRHPQEMSEPEIKAFLTELAREGNVVASTQNQALNALLFLYREVLNVALGSLANIPRAKKHGRIPVVLSREEVQNVLSHLSGTPWLMANLLYGAGLRLLECVRLRVKDVDFDMGYIIVREGKGDKDRHTVLPRQLIPHLQQQIVAAKTVWEKDLREGFGEVSLPGALERKYPHAAREFAWQYLFPATHRSVVPGTAMIRRHHIDESVLQRAFKAAVRTSGLVKPASCHSLRHSFATHLLDDGYDIRTVQQILGHKDVRTTMVYTHVMNMKGKPAVKSPLDTFPGIVREPHTRFLSLCAVQKS